MNRGYENETIQRNHMYLPACEWSRLLRVDLELEPAVQRMGQRQKDFGLQFLMAKA